MKRSRPRTLPSSPARAASASRTAAPSSTRAHARNAGGMPSSTATLMNRYGMPQRVDTAAKAAHARALIAGKPTRRRGGRPPPPRAPAPPPAQARVPGGGPRVAHRAPVAAPADEPRPAQHPEVLGDAGGAGVQA